MVVDAYQVFFVVSAVDGTLLFDALLEREVNGTDGSVVVDVEDTNESRK